jgi:hypothetical protein
VFGRLRIIDWLCLVLGLLSVYNPARHHISPHCFSPVAGSGSRFASLQKLFLKILLSVFKSSVENWTLARPSICQIRSYFLPYCWAERWPLHVPRNSLSLFMFIFSLEFLFTVQRLSLVSRKQIWSNPDPCQWPWSLIKGIGSRIFLEGLYYLIGTVHSVYSLLIFKIFCCLKNAY